MAYDLTLGGLYAVIPARVLYDERLRPTAKLLYGEIVRLAQSSGYCYATNKQLMGVCGLSDKSVSELVGQLRACGHIRLEMVRRNGESGDIIQRRIFIGQDLAKSGPEMEGEIHEGGYPEKSGDVSRKIGRGYPEKSGGIISNNIINNIPPISPQKGGSVKKRKRNKSAPEWKPERFEKFWEYYRTHGRDNDRAGAVREWDRLKPEDDLIDTMARALAAQAASDEWRRGIGIPYACRWLRNERWRDTGLRRSESDTEEAPPRRRYIGKRVIDGEEVDVFE